MGSGWTYWQCLGGTKSVAEREERTSESWDKLGGKIEIQSQNQRTTDSLQTNQAKDIFRKWHLSQTATSNCWFPKAFLALSFLMERLRGEEVVGISISKATLQLQQNAFSVAVGQLAEQQKERYESMESQETLSSLLLDAVKQRLNSDA